MMTFSLAAPVLLGAVALAVDSSGFYTQRNQMQAAVDGAALAVAKELHLYRKSDSDLAKLAAFGKTHVEALLAQDKLEGNPHSTEVLISAEENEIDVALTMRTKALLPISMWGENPIRVSSQARAYGQSRLCVLGLHTSKSDTIKADGGAAMTAPDCAVQSNSNDPAGLNVSSDSAVTAKVICTTGGANGAGSLTPAPRTDCPPLDDPLAARQPPPIEGCYGPQAQVLRTSQTISAGHYCGGLKIEKNAVITLSPGDYVISGGVLEVTDAAKLIGENVSFYFRDDAATFKFNPNTTIDLSAPKEGPMAGILFYENRNAAAGRSFEIKSRNARRLLGTVYLPRGILKIDVKAQVAAESAYTVIVARQLDVKGANLIVNSDYGGTDVPVPEGVGPNSLFVMLDK